MAERTPRHGPNHPAAPAPPREIKDRLTVVERVMHQVAGCQPTTVSEVRFARWLKSIKVKPKDYELVAGPNWQPLLPESLKIPFKPGMVTIINTEHNRLDQQPTEEEKAQIAARVLEVSFVSYTGGKGHGTDPAWIIPPGESMRGYPTSMDLIIRSLADATNYTVALVSE